MSTQRLLELMERVEQSEEAKLVNTPVRKWIVEATAKIDLLTRQVAILTGETND